MQYPVIETKNNEDFLLKNKKENLINNPNNQINELIYKEKLITSILKQRLNAIFIIQRNLKGIN